MTPRPTHILRHEHRVIEQALRAIEGICLKLKVGEIVPADALVQSLDFIQNYADRFHHLREEEVLFPALEEAGFGKQGGALHFLEDEHQTERELMAKLEFAVEEYECGDADAALQFIEASDQFRRHLIGHIQKEDTLLFRIAEELLDEESKTELMQRLAQAGDKDDNAILEYERLAAELENTWTV